MLVKILGGVDLLSAFVFLMLIFGITPFMQLVLFCSCLLALKGLFVFAGNVLSGLDLIFAISLLLSIFFALPTLMLWIPAFILLAKGFVSFI